MTNSIDTKRALANAVATQAASGWRVESQTDVQAILVKGKNVNHTLHAILTFFTAGMWACVWLPVWLMNRRQVLIVSVDEYGNVTLNNG